MSGPALSGSERLQTLSNPFRGAVMGNPWDPGSAQYNVDAIHRDVFETCTQAVEEVRHGGCSAGIVIHGEPGSGKTHLIGRLQRQLLNSSPTQTLEHCSQAFAYVRLNTNATQLIRHVRRNVAGDLLRSLGEGPSQLERMVLTRIMELDGGAGDLAQWWEFQLEHRRDGLASLIEQLGLRENLSPTFVLVLQHLLLRQHRIEAAQWFKGDALSETAYERLGIASESDSVDPETRSREVLEDFARLAGRQIPLVICFDQIEALQVAPDDTGGFFAYGNLVSDLHSADENLVLISCLQTGKYDLLRRAIAEHAYDRVKSRAAIALALLTPAQAESLLRMRLSASGVAKARPEGAAELWPLTAQDVRGFVGPRGCTPRSLLEAAALRLQVLQEGGRASPPPVQNIAGFLETEWERREDEAQQTLHPDTSQQILTHGIPHLVRVVEPGWRAAGSPRPADLDFVFEEPRGEARVGVMIYEDDGQRLAARLKRLNAAYDPNVRGIDKLVLLRDERRPVSQGAVKTRAHLRDLERKHAVVCGVSPAALAALDAMRSLLADAQAGDLAAGAQTVAPETVLDWLQQNLAGALKELADVLVLPGTEPTDSDHSQWSAALQDQLNREPIMYWSDAAAAVGVSGRQSDELLHSVSQRGDLFGVIRGEPAVVFSARPGRTAATEASPTR